MMEEMRVLFNNAFLYNPPVRHRCSHLRYPHVWAECCAFQSSELYKDATRLLLRAEEEYKIIVEQLEREERERKLGIYQPVTTTPRQVEAGLMAITAPRLTTGGLEWPSC
jgi:hypothetical protein